MFVHLIAPRLAVIVTSEGHQGDWEGEQEDDESGDDEAEDAVVLSLTGRQVLGPVLHE